MSPEQLQAIIAKAKAEMAARAAKLPASMVVPPLAPAVKEPTPAPAATAAWSWNAEQKQAITFGLANKSFILIGAAGTGKTTTLRGMLQAKLDANSIPMLQTSTEYIFAGTPGVVLVSYTRRAVRNIRRQMPDQLKAHCLTIHKLLEYKPEFYEDYNDKGELVNKVRFVPSRNQMNPLPRSLSTIVIDESSMVSLDLFDRLLDALPHRDSVQFVFLGDLNQLPPVYGQAILGKKLLELPIVELTQVYRQALESPIISLALAVKNNNFTEFNRNAVELWSNGKFKKEDGRWNHLAFDAKNLNCIIPKDPKQPATIVLEKEGRGKVTLQVWKRQIDAELALTYMAGQLKSWIDTGYYNPDEDLVLCPFNEGFGTNELNLHIADRLAKKRDAMVFEIIAGFKTCYYAVGDKLLVDKEEAIVLSIDKNPRYLGKRPVQPSKELDRWGRHGKVDLAKDATEFDIDAALATLSTTNIEEKVNQASHAVRVKMLDREEEVVLATAGELNATSLAYAITVHKAQGSECRKVFFLTHHRHSAMMYRELVYTAITRAAEELHFVLTPFCLETAAKKPRIKGDTLAAKLEYFKKVLSERMES